MLSFIKQVIKQVVYNIFNTFNVNKDSSNKGDKDLFLSYLKTCDEEIEICLKRKVYKIENIVNHYTEMNNLPKCTINYNLNFGCNMSASNTDLSIEILRMLSKDRLLYFMNKLNVDQQKIKAIEQFTFNEIKKVHKKIVINDHQLVLSLDNAESIFVWMIYHELYHYKRYNTSNLFKILNILNIVSLIPIIGLPIYLNDLLGSSLGILIGISFIYINKFITINEEYNADLEGVKLGFGSEAISFFENEIRINATKSIWVKIYQLLFDDHPSSYNRLKHIKHHINV